MLDSESISPTPPVPTVVQWFKVYIGFLAAVYLFLGLFGLVFVINPALFEIERAEAWVISLVFLAISLPFAALFLTPFFLKPARWVWIFDLVLIALGLGSCLTLPFAILLLIFWVKPETQQYFGRGSA